jgi:hypothetical protein
MHMGGCFCGAVRYETGDDLKGVTYCHCSKCRRWHGHAGAWTAAEEFRLTQEGALKWHRVSPTVRRGFCGECGSSLFFEEAGNLMGICPGSFDAPTGLKEKAHIYVGSKGDYYEIVDALVKYETMP